MNIIKAFFGWLSNKQSMSINHCNINGQSYTITGNNVTISNGRVIVDGVEINPGNDKRFAITQVIVNAEKVERLEVDCANVTVNGSVHGKVEVDCGNIDIGGDLVGEAYTDCGNVKIKGQKVRAGVEDRHGKYCGHTV